MDFDDQWRHPRLSFRLYVPLTELLIVSRRGEERERSTRWDGMCHVGPGALLAPTRTGQ